MTTGVGAGGRWRSVRRSKTMVVGLVLVAGLVVIALGAGVLAPYSPIKVDPLAALQAPSTTHIMGTDQYGRDILSRVLLGSRLTLMVGPAAIAISLFFGLLAGVAAGYVGGRVDTVLMRLVDVMLAFPGVLLALGAIAVLGVGLMNVTIAIGIAYVPNFTRLIRATVLSTKQNLYVEASRAMGAPALYVVARHVLPNIMAPVLVLTSSAIAWAILTGAALNFLGLGTQPPTPEWGVDLSEGRSYLGAAWWMTTFPGVGIMLAVLGTNLLGDGLRDVLDPRLKE
ncbi:MAG: ABC transporter permease [Candidatus Rokubacteria bacterium]|nr:ABC transporter permease [Candidatus Rokubacteria bacterium]